MKPDNVMGIVQAVFLLLGLAGMVGAIALAMHTRSFVAHASHARGAVTDMIQRASSGSNGGGYTWAPQVQFRDAADQPHEFVSSTSSNPPSYRVGEPVDVLYNPARPSDAQINGFFSLWGAALIIGILSGVMFMVGAVILVARRRRKHLVAWLRQSGRPVQATIEGAERNTSLRVNGRSPWCLTCQWQDPSTSLVHVFTSESLWFDPAPYIQNRTATVYIDPRNPKRYDVDLSFLPKLA